MDAADLPPVPAWYLACCDADHQRSAISIVHRPLIIFVCATCSRIEEWEYGVDASATALVLDRQWLLRQAARGPAGKAQP